MKGKYTCIIPLVTALLLESCGLFGIHFKVHNPKKPGKMPEFSEETILLGEMTKYRSCYDAHYYDLSVTIDRDKKAISGVVDIYAIAQENFDSLQIDLHQNFEITRLVEKPSGTELKYHRRERALFIDIPKQKGDAFIIQVAYNGKPVIAKKPPWKGGFVWKKDKDGNPWVGVTCESFGASLWWALKDHTAEEPDSMRLHYTVPQGLIAVGNGQFEGKTEKEGNTTFHWFVSYPINTYNVSVYVGKFLLIEDEYIGINGDTLSMTHYVLKRNYEKARKHFQQLHSELYLFEKRFGEYPWYRDGYKLVESPYPGMEHQTAIAYGSRYKNDKYFGTDYIIVHETAHEWWGNSVTAKDMADVWIHEGFATYAEALYHENIKGYGDYMNTLYFYRILIKNKYPVVVIKDRRWFHFRKNSDVYSKGAWILHTLRVQINDDELFFSIIKTFYERNRYQLVESQDFIDVVNELTKKDYSWFFDQYLFNNLVPELEFATSYNGILYYRWAKTNDDFDQLTLEVECEDQVFLITPSQTVKQLQLPSNSKGMWKYRFTKDVLCAFKKNNKLLK